MGDFYYITSHSGQLSLLPSAGREVSTGQEAVAVLCSWEDNRRPGVTSAMSHTVVYPFTGSVT